jgi:hypothetical protein
MMSPGTDKKISNLMLLIDPKIKTVRKTEILRQIETIHGYDLVFILSFIMRNNYSGNLVIVNEEDYLSGITFIYGDIVKVDYPDQEHLLGNLIVDNEILSKFEMQEIVQKSGGLRLGDYLVDNQYITQQQLRNLLFKQTNLRLTKYLSSLSIRIKFSFDGESSDSVLINKIDYTDILYKWIFQNFNPAWLEEYGNFYAKCSFTAELGAAEFLSLKDYPEAYDTAFKLSHLRKGNFTYNELFKAAHTTRNHLLRVLHFLVLAGYVQVVRPKELRGADDAHAEQADLMVTLDRDLKQAQESLLNKKYFVAFGLLNKYSGLVHTHPTVTFYFIWIKLIGAYYYNHIIDITKVAQDFNQIDYFKMNAGEFYYVRSLLQAVQKKYRESDESYMRAIGYDKLYRLFPINQDLSFVDRIVKFFNKLYGKSG